MYIMGKKVKLRSLEIGDIENLNNWSNEPELWKLLGGWHFPYSKISTENWINNINDNNMKDYVFGIENDKEKLIGTANLINIDWKNRSAFHGMMIGDRSNRGKIYAFDTVMAIMRYAFDELGLERLDGDMIETNHLSINFYTKRCGWKIEGKKENSFFRAGKFFNKIIVGITKTEYYELVKKNNYWN